MIALLLIGVSAATTSFDPTTPEIVFTGEETYTQDGEVQLWGAIERHTDHDTALFVSETFNSVTAWPAESAWAPWITECFGSSEPGTGTFLLHLGRSEEWAEGTPILFVPGAGDNGSRGFITMATRMDRTNRPVYVLTFAHPHGDVFRQAEVVADAIARILERTGAEQVDLVSHSKGGIASAIYLSNHAGAEWTRSDYMEASTVYRGDVRRAVFIATPLGGIDTGFRWPTANLASLTSDTALAPVSWNTWYPYSTSVWSTSTDLSDQDFLADGSDLFPSHRQLLARWDDVYELPGATPWLGTYSAQIDWYTTYHGGVGFYSTSDGIDAAIEAGDNVLGSLAAEGVDPSVQLFLLAGSNPVMPNGTEDFATQYMGEAWVDMASSGSDEWAALVTDALGDSLEDIGITEEEVHGLAGGKLVIGEISGPSDGLVFIDSATQAERLTARGAEVVQTYVANLSHLDLLYASPITGQLLIDGAETDPTENGWMAAFGARYIEADTLGWVEDVLADDSSAVDTDDTGTDDTGLDDTEVDDTEVDDTEVDDTESDGTGSDGTEFDDTGSDGTNADGDQVNPKTSGCGCAAGSRLPLSLPLLALPLLIAVPRRRTPWTLR